METKIAQERTHRINGEIRVPEVRLTGLDGEMIGIVRTSQALAMAEEADVDLVEVAPNARPPVCRLMDYGKFRYQEQKKAQEQKNQDIAALERTKKTRVQADSVEELLEKIKNVDWDQIKSEEKAMTGGRFDFSI